MIRKLFLPTVILLVSLVVIYLTQTNTPITPSTPTYEEIYGRSRPEIVSHFACGDYCPGDASKYTIRIYSGVTDAGECAFLGGFLYTYYGWGETTVCSLTSVKR